VNRFVSLVVMAIIGATLASAQSSSVVLQWQDFPQERAYEPIPVICLHGLNSDSSNSWAQNVGILSNYFSATYYWQGRVSLTPQRPGQPGSAYIETFDYGCYGRPENIPTQGHLQTFDSIKMNAWSGVYNNWGQTLSQRIDQVRTTYKPPNLPRQPVILLCHSMGGVVAHYYLTQAGNDGSVLRMITLGTPHYGSDLPNISRAATRGWLRRHAIRSLVPLEWVLKADYENTLHYAIPPVDHPEKTGVQELCVLNAQNSNQVIATYLCHTPVPTYGEYIFNSFEAYFTGGPGYHKYTDVTKLSLSNLTQGAYQQALGDIIVPVWSQEGRTARGSAPDILNGTSTSGQPIRPVIFGMTTDPFIFAAWNCYHSSEPHCMPAILKSIFGVTYAASNSFGQNFSSYLPPQDASISPTVCHSDEPGIGQMILLCQGSHANPFVVHSLNTWTNDGTNYPKNAFTNRSELTDYQIIGDASASIRSLALVGAKNRAQNPIASATNGMNIYYWAQDGNEYLPASLDLRLAHDSQPDFGSVSPTNFSRLLTSKCLAWQNTNGEFRQYGLFENFDFVPLTSNSAPFYYFARGTNLAGLHTPVAERGFDVPVDSATMVNSLCAINASQKANGSTQTQWTQDVTEWIDIPAGATNITLNFVPVYNPNTWGCRMEDAFTESVYEEWTAYEEVSHTFTIPPDDAARCLQVFYSAYVGGLDDSFVYYDGDEEPSAVVPALTPNSLAGIPLLICL
jgi:pimeloyl-ACP methyl ester carboxylesterase